MTFLFRFRLFIFFAYFIKYFIHAFYVFAGIIHKKLQLGDYPYLVFYAGAQLVTYFGSVRFDSLQRHMGIGIVKETQKYPRDSQIGGNPNFGYSNKCIRQIVYTLALKYSGKVLLYYPCEFLLTF